MELRTVPQLVKQCKLLDLDTAINESMVNTLIQDGEIRHIKRGSRCLLTFEDFTETINSTLFLFSYEQFPTIRTIPQAVKLLKMRGENFNEKNLYELIRSEHLNAIKIGTRYYVAMEEFEKPHDISLYHFKYKSNTENKVVEDATQQLEKILMQSQAIADPNVKRV